MDILFKRIMIKNILFNYSNVVSLVRLKSYFYYFFYIISIPNNMRKK